MKIILTKKENTIAFGKLCFPPLMRVEMKGNVLIMDNLFGEEK